MAATQTTLTEQFSAQVLAIAREYVPVANLWDWEAMPTQLESLSIAPPGESPAEDWPALAQLRGTLVTEVYGDTMAEVPWEQLTAGLLAQPIRFQLEPTAPIGATGLVGCAWLTALSQRLTQGIAVLVLKFNFTGTLAVRGAPPPGLPHTIYTGHAPLLGDDHAADYEQIVPL